MLFVGIIFNQIKTHIFFHKVDISISGKMSLTDGWDKLIDRLLVILLLKFIFWINCLITSFSSNKSTNWDASFAEKSSIWIFSDRNPTLRERALLTWLDSTSEIQISFDNLFFVSTI